MADFFDLLAQGETVALERLAGLADACGLTARALADYLPRPGCQAYPSYAARLARGRVRKVPTGPRRLARTS
ncbi:hypothetical protein ACH4NT_26180 [Streptomyces lydicus]|uniref:hypothetical protein n=1 Tax=Streptomyces lydicus TaxID=47763 RepID=UPI0037B71826